MSVPSHGNGEWGFSFDFNPSPVAQGNLLMETYSKSKQNSAQNVSNSSPVVDNVWEFKDAFSETGSEHKPVSWFDLVCSFVLVYLNAHFLRCGSGNAQVLVVGRGKGCYSCWFRIAHSRWCS